MAIDEKFEHDIDSLIEVGKEKGYLTYGDVNDMLPDEMSSADDLDDLITTIGTQGIDLLDGPKFAGDKDFDLEDGEDVELDLTPGALEKTNDPVRMYLREMGTVPLLTREGEVEIAKRIERGQVRVMKALSRSPIVIREIIALGEDLKRLSSCSEQLPEPLILRVTASLCLQVREIFPLGIFSRPGAGAAPLRNTVPNLDCAKRAGAYWRLMKNLSTT